MSTKLPLLPLRDLVVLPGAVVPLLIGRESSITAIETAILDHEFLVLIFTQLDPDVDLPQRKDIPDVGTIAEILQVIKLSDGTLKALFEPRVRIKLEALELGDFYTAEFSEIMEVTASEQGQKLFDDLATKFARWARFVETPMFYLGRYKSDMNLSWATDRIATNLRLSNEEKADCLKETSVDKRIQLLARKIDELVAQNAEKLADFESKWQDQPQLSAALPPTSEFKRPIEELANSIPEMIGSALMISNSPTNLEIADLTYNQLSNGDSWLYLTKGLVREAGFEIAVLTREHQNWPLVFLNYIAQDAVLRKFDLLKQFEQEECVVISIELPGQGHHYFLLSKAESDKPVIIAIAIEEAEADMHDTAELKAQLLSTLGGPFSALWRDSVL